MLIRLALETRSQHAGADADRLALLDDPTAARYRAFLTAVYGFEARYERMLIQTPGLEPRIVRDCARLAHLRNDLRALGLTDGELAALPSPPIPAFRSEGQALGWAYVVERNTLLHGLLRRHLWRLLPRELGQAGTYLAAHASPGTHYRELGIDLDAAARRTIPSIIVEAAHAAFACQRLWFAQMRAVEARRLAS